MGREKEAQLDIVALIYKAPRGRDSMPGLPMQFEFYSL